MCSVVTLGPVTTTANNPKKKRKANQELNLDHVLPKNVSYHLTIGPPLLLFKRGPRSLCCLVCRFHSFFLSRSCAFIAEEQQALCGTQRDAATLELEHDLRAHSRQGPWPSRTSPRAGAHTRHGKNVASS